MIKRGGRRGGESIQRNAGFFRGGLLLGLLWTQGVRAATWNVTVTADSGPGSLRQAILEANAAPGLDIIQFQIPGDGVHTIAVATPLPAVTDPVVIDGASQPGYWLSPVIELDGVGAGNNAGLRLLSGGCTVRGLMLVRFGGSGIQIEGAGANVIQGNYIGTDGYLDLGNALEGIWVYNSSGNVIGGTNPAEANLISCNGDAGIYLLNGESNAITGNLVGTVSPGNANNGITVYNSAGNSIGSGKVGSRNVISGNRGSGVYLYGPGATGNQVAGNSIGASLDRSRPLPNAGDGITLQNADANILGGTNAGDGNLVSGNALAGLSLNGSSSNLVYGNFIGVGASGSLALGNGYAGVTLAASTNNCVGGGEAGMGNCVAGNKKDGIFIVLNSTGNTVAGNLIGTDNTGTSRLGNGFNGITVSGSSENLIGGSGIGAGNIISGNTNHGVYLTADAPANVIEGNLIGCDGSGSNAIPNGLSGVRLDSGENRVGRAKAPNIISGNGDYGVLLNGSLARSNIVQGNRVGTSRTGAGRLGNGSAGVGLLEAPYNKIGGEGLHEGNLLSGNTDAGVYLFKPGATGNQILGNYLGTEATGLASLGNAMEGIYVEGASANVIGGSAPGAANVISGNRTRGILLTNATANVIEGNLVGLAADGKTALANAFHNIECEAGTSETSIRSNRIAYAGSIFAGVRIRQGSSRNLISANSIFGNGALGIDLGPAGVTPNDPGDADAGANNLQNFPEIIQAFGGTAVAVSGALNSTAGSAFTIEIFANANGDNSGYGEGAVYLGSIPVVTDAAGYAGFSATFPLAAPAGWVLTTTATDAAGNTSEFSADAPVAAGPQLALAAGPGGISMSWPDCGPHFRLHQTDSLAPPVKWVHLAEPPISKNGRWVWTAPPGSGNAFYRLEFE